MIARLLGFAVAVSALTATAAQAAPITYDVNFTLPKVDPLLSRIGGEFSISGTITTDGKLGVLQGSDIYSANLNIDGAYLGFDKLYGTALSAAADGKLLFNSAHDLTGGYLRFSSADHLAAVDFSAPTEIFEPLRVGGGKPGSDGLITFGYNAYSADTSFTLGTTVVSSVPLPASAPMFGAAILAMSMVGYGVKRRKAA